MSLQSEFAAFRKLISRQEKINMDLSSFEVPGLKLIGRSYYPGARAPLPGHFHPGIVEICFLEKGLQSYRTSEKSYFLKGGDIFLTPPDEIHQSRGSVQEPCILYFLWLDTKTLPFLGLPEKAGDDLKKLLYSQNLKVISTGRKKENYFEQILFHAWRDGPSALTHILSALYQLFGLLFEASGETPKEGGDLELLDESGLTPEIRRTARIIRNSPESPLDLPNLAGRASLSVSRFKQRFRNETGFSPGLYQTIVRIELSKKLLLSEIASVTDIAYDLGFSSSQHFSSVFKKRTGITPTGWKMSAGRERSSILSEDLSGDTVERIDSLPDIPIAPPEGKGFV